MNPKPICEKCDRTFSNIQNLENHWKKKIPCDRELKCEKCDKEFKHISNLQRHQNRKNPCEPIAGDPTKNTPPNTCHFCYRKFAHKQSLQHHFNICKIKNGGMELLYKKIEELTNKIDRLELGNNNIINNNNTVIDSNHHNTTINLQLVAYDSDAHGDLMSNVLDEYLPLILKQPYDEGRTHDDQLAERIKTILMRVYRNPEYKQLQNVYVVPEKKKDNAFMYIGDIKDVECKRWKISDWDTLGKDMLSKIWNYADSNKTVSKKEDVLNVMKHMFGLAGLGESAVDNMTDENVRELWTDIGKKLKYTTLII
jgi:hypothetical protein